MIFCVLFDPDVIRASANAGEWGEDHLIGVLQCLLQNCLVAETSCWRVGDEIKEAVQAILDQDTRSKVISLLGALQTRQRFVEAIDDSDFPWDAPLSDIVVAQGQNSNLDVIVTQQEGPKTATVEFTKIQYLNQSNFAQNRQRTACGVNLEQSQMSASDFFQQHFGRLHLAETDFHIIDYVIGEEFTRNFSRNLPYWIDFFKSRNRPVTFTIHTTPGRLSDARARLTNRLTHLSQGSGVTTVVIVHDQLPHERFLVTKQFCFEIGRGVDLFDPETGMNRDIRLGLSSRSFTFCV